MSLKDWAGVALAIVGAVGLAVARAFAERAAEAAARRLRALLGADRKPGVELLELPGEEQPAGTEAELEEMWAQAFMEASDAPESVKQELRELRGAFQARLDRIEQRFPEETTLEKIASINDAILATKIEQLEKSIKDLNDRTLSKWDVATVVFAIIAAVGVVAGAIFAVANFVMK